MIALVIIVISVALLVGLAAGLMVANPSSTVVSPSVALKSSLTSGWVYQHDSVTNKSYAYHLSTWPTGPVIDETYELQNDPGTVSGCGLDRAEPDC